MSELNEAADRLEAVLKEEFGEDVFDRRDFRDGTPRFKAWGDAGSFCVQVDVILAGDASACVSVSTPFRINVSADEADAPSSAVRRAINDLNRLDAADAGIVCTIRGDGIVEFSMGSVAFEDVAEAVDTTRAFATVHTKQLAELVFGFFILPEHVAKVGGEALAKALLGDSMLLYESAYGSKTRIGKAVSAWHKRRSNGKDDDDER